MKSFCVSEGTPLKRIRVRQRSTEASPDTDGDCARIVNVCADRGYAVFMHEAEEMWLAYSHDMAAGWMALPEDDEELFWAVKPYFEEVE